MNSDRALKLIIGLAMVVLVASIALRLTSRRAPVESPAAQTQPEPVATLAPRRDSVIGHARPIAAPVGEAEESGTNDLALPPEKVAEYLQRHNRNAASLLAAFRALQDTNLLNEAAERFPNDPQVQWSMLTSDTLDAAGRRKWLDAFKTSSPNNSLADYLSAAEHFKAGDRAAALKEITDASGKAAFQDYTMEAMIDEQDLRRASGQSAMLAMHGHGWAEASMKQYPQLKTVSDSIAEAAQTYRDSGDPDAANHLIQMGLGLAERLNSREGNKFIIGELVGFAIEARMLKNLDANTKYDALGGKTPSERLEEMKQSKAAYYELSAVLPKAYGVLSESEWVTYSDRMKTFGERAALKWLQEHISNVEGK